RSSPWTTRRPRRHADSVVSRQNGRALRQCCSLCAGARFFCRICSRRDAEAQRSFPVALLCGSAPLREIQECSALGLRWARPSGPRLESVGNESTGGAGSFLSIVGPLASTRCEPRIPSERRARWLGLASPAGSGRQAHFAQKRAGGYEKAMLRLSV